MLLTVEMGNLVRPENPWMSVQCCSSLAWTEAALNEIPQQVGTSTNSGAGRSAPDKNISETSDADSKGILFYPHTGSKLIPIYLMVSMREIAFV